MRNLMLTAETHHIRRMLFASGEIDIVSSAQLTETCLTHLGSALTQELVLDLADVTFFDARGISALVRVRHAADHLGKRFHVINISRQAHVVLQLAGLERAFTASAIPAAV